MIGYVAKDKDGELYLHREKPYYNAICEGWFSTPENIDITNEFSDFDDLKYTDEPIKVEINIKRL